MVKLILLSLPVVLTIFFIFIKQDKISIPEEDKPVWAVALQVANEFENNYSLKMISVKMSSDKKLLKTLGLEFSLDKVLSKNEGRKLLLKCVNEFLFSINDFESIQLFLADRPFTIKNIELTFFLHDTNGSVVVEPDISCISLSKGIITYRIRDAKPPQLFKYAEKETIEEARRIVREKMQNCGSTRRNYVLHD